MQTQTNIPEQLRPQVDAAVLWINQHYSQNDGWQEGQTFEVTGLVDYEAALTAANGENYELGLVLCDGEICAREQIQVQPIGDGFEFSLVRAAVREIPALLDPPKGIRGGWLENELAKYEFVVLLFYRGLW
ncbi:MAG: hypothetical protein ACI9UU_003880 [Candidatus Azotimanducaceae bacterium]|jgi:hypothetical protein